MKIIVLSDSLIASASRQQPLLYCNRACNSSSKLIQPRMLARDNGLGVVWQSAANWASCVQMLSLKLCHRPYPPCMAYLIHVYHDTKREHTLPLYTHLMQLRPAFFKTG